MAAPVIPCDSCGSPIPDSDLETGAAITLLGKRYCMACKTEAIQSVSLEDLSARPAQTPAKRAAAPPPRTAPPAPKAAERPAPRAPVPKPAAAPAPPKPAPPPAPAAGPERKAAARRPVAVSTTPSRKPLLIAGGAVAGILVIVGALFIFKGGTPPPDTGGSTGQGASGSTSKGPAPDRDAQARNAYGKVVELAGRAGASWDHILAAAENARPACRGTEWEKKLEEIRSRAAQEKEMEDAAREIAPLLDELKGAVATDREFKRYPELQTKFQHVLEMASKTGSVKRDEIRALKMEYNGRYEKLAEPHYAEIHEAAVQLADERRYDDALRRINSFPQHLRHSGAWMTLEKLKQDIERRKKKK